MKYYAIQQTEREATVAIYGDITPYQWDESDVSAYSITQEIKGLDVDVINVRINSCGGSVAEGWAIYNALKAHPAKVKTFADGFVASAAVYPFLAGTERIANSVSAFYLHQVLTSVTGNADDLRKAADELETLNAIGLKAFEDLGIDAEQLLQLQKAETWLTPAEALDLGIATELQARADTQSVAMQIMQILTEPRQKLEQNAVEIDTQEQPQKQEEEPIEGQITLQEFMNKF